MKQVILMAAAVMSGFAFAEAGGISGEVGGQLLAAGDNKVMILSDKGDVEWQHPAGKPLPGECLR